MRSIGAVLIAVIAVSMPSGAAYAQAPGTCAGMTAGQLASLNGFVPFQGTGSLWNTDISAAPVDPNSDNIINFIGTSVTLHPDFGSDLYDGSSIGIPYQVVAGSQPMVPIVFGLYPDESDPGPMPIPGNALIEGYPEPGSGDRHVLVLDKDSCWLYELYSSYPEANGRWKADSSAVWNMMIDEQRPYTWTSADAAGLPIFAGLARYDEVAAGAINHALRFTVPVSQQAFVAPASHWASSNTDPSAPPMGTRLRLRADFDISGFSAQNQVILTALKRYGMILADNGSAIYISGAPDDRWNNDDLHNLGSIAASDFEVMELGTIYTPGNVPAGAAPTISSFTASPAAVRRRRSITLSWNVSDSEYSIISPTIGAVRGASAAVVVSKTTTFTLYSTNQFGRATRTVTVKVR